MNEVNFIENWTSILLKLEKYVSNVTRIDYYK